MPRSPPSWGILRDDADWFVSAATLPLDAAERIGGEYEGEVPASAAFLYSERRRPAHRSGARAERRRRRRNLEPIPVLFRSYHVLFPVTKARRLVPGVRTCPLRGPRLGHVTGSV